MPRRTLARHTLALAITMIMAATVAAIDVDASGPRARVEILLDASTGVAASPAGTVAAIGATVADALARSGRADIHVAVRLFGSRQDESQADCFETHLVADWGPPSQSGLTSLDQLAAGSPLRPLAQALRMAKRDLSKVSGERHLVIITTGVDTCGGDACAAAAELNSTVNPRLFVLATDNQVTGAVSCIGDAQTVASLDMLSAQLAELFIDVAATTGISIAHYAEPDAPVTRFSVAPITTTGRTDLAATRDGAHAATYGLAPGRYQITFDDPSLPSREIAVADGRISQLAVGQGSLAVRLSNYYDVPVGADVTVSLSAPAVAATTQRPDTRVSCRAPTTCGPATTQPARTRAHSQRPTGPMRPSSAFGKAAASPAQTSPGKKATSPATRRIPHSTLPVVARQSSADAPRGQAHANASRPAATAPASRPAATAPATRPAATATASRPAATAPASRPAAIAPATAGDRGAPHELKTNGPALRLPADRYEVVIELSGAPYAEPIRLRRSVEIAAGGDHVVAVRLGGVRVEPGAAPVTIYGPDGQRVATAHPYSTLDLLPGRYELRDRSGRRTIDVRPGDVVVIER